MLNISRQISREISREISRQISREISRQISREISREIYDVLRSNWLRRLRKEKRASKPVSLCGDFRTSKSVSIRTNTNRTNTNRTNTNRMKTNRMNTNRTSADKLELLGERTIIVESTFAT